MSILEKAVSIASTLDPSLLSELEQEFGEDFEAQLKKAIESVRSGAAPEPSFEQMKKRAFEVTDSEYYTEYSLLALREFAESLGIRPTGGHLAITRNIYTSLEV